MSDKFLFAWLAAAMIIVTVLVACGGGVGTGVGRGSGMGGTGISIVKGNVAAVNAQSEYSVSNTLFAELSDFLITPLKAQTGVPGIQVSGGDQATTTDATGNFSLVGVNPSNNFILTFTLNSGQRINLQIGAVPAGTLVRVSDIVLNTSQGTATPSKVTKEDNPDDEKSTESEDEDDQSVDGTSTDDPDGTSTDDPDGTSTDDPDDA